MGGLLRQRDDVKFAVVAFKVSLFIMVYMLVRWTIPRFRFDQLMGLAWKVLIPLAILNLVCVMFIREFDSANKPFRSFTSMAAASMRSD